MHKRAMLAHREVIVMTSGPRARRQVTSMFVLGFNGGLAAFACGMLFVALLLKILLG